VRTAAVQAVLASIVVGGLLAGCSSSDTGGTTGKADRNPVLGAASGPIAFVGLAVPHLARRLVSGGHRAVLPLSALLGAALLVGADVAGRVVRAPAEVPAGVMTALVGVPVLVFLVRRRGAVS
jgi:hypothetical protein